MGEKRIFANYNQATEFDERTNCPAIAGRAGCETPP